MSKEVKGYLKGTIISAW